jgi:hypothetical protein
MRMGIREGMGGVMHGLYIVFLVFWALGFGCWCIFLEKGRGRGGMYIDTVIHHEETEACSPTPFPRPSKFAPSTKTRARRFIFKPKVADARFMLLDRLSCGPKCTIK